MPKRSMDKKQAEELIRSKVEVSRQKVAIAKEFVLSHFSPVTGKAIEALAHEMNAVMPEELVSHPSVDPMPTIEKIASSISWRLAGCEAIWGLIHSGAIIPSDFDMQRVEPQIRWTTAFAGSGGETSGLELAELGCAVPRHLRLAPSRQFGPSDEILVDPDLYLRRIKVPLTKPVSDSLEEAVRCFRHGLYTACVAMLGKASEESWVELGSTLADAAELGTERVEKLKAGLTGWELGIQSKIQKVVNLTKLEPVRNIMKSVELRPVDIISLVTWSDLVRESRNVLHAGREPLIPNTYEKVAMLLLNTASCMETVFRLIEAARQASATAT